MHFFNRYAWSTPLFVVRNQKGRCGLATVRYTNVYVFGFRVLVVRDHS